MFPFAFKLRNNDYYKHQDNREIVRGKERRMVGRNKRSSKEKEKKWVEIGGRERKGGHMF